VTAHCLYWPGATPEGSWRSHCPRGDRLTNVPHMPSGDNSGPLRVCPQLLPSSKQGTQTLLSCPRSMSSRSIPTKAFGASHRRGVWCCCVRGYVQGRYPVGDCWSAAPNRASEIPVVCRFKIRYAPRTSQPTERNVYLICVVSVAIPRAVPGSWRSGSTTSSRSAPYRLMSPFSRNTHEGPPTRLPDQPADSN